MKCSVCNSELQEGQSFCSYCGTKIEAEQPAEAVAAEATVVTPEEPSVQQNPTETKNPADTHALVGLILGICSMVCCCLGLPAGIVGIIFSAKGLKSETRKGMAIPGLILSILSIVNFFSFWIGFMGDLEGNVEMFEYMSFLF
ncbi:MAG: zinc-ribbon domain-containing protein [Clostridia bacterium]|nr:zinc-ribbon domain-containing protein [Clostridia bacterium]